MLMLFLLYIPILTCALFERILLECLELLSSSFFFHLLSFPCDKPCASSHFTPVFYHLVMLMRNITFSWPFSLLNFPRSSLLSILPLLSTSEEPVLEAGLSCSFNYQGLFSLSIVNSLFNVC